MHAHMLSRVLAPGNGLDGGAACPWATSYGVWESRAGRTRPGAPQGLASADARSTSPVWSESGRLAHVTSARLRPSTLGGHSRSRLAPSRDGLRLPQHPIAALHVSMPALFFVASSSRTAARCAWTPCRAVVVEHLAHTHTWSRRMDSTPGIPQMVLLDYGKGQAANAPPSPHAHPVDSARRSIITVNPVLRLPAQGPAAMCSEAISLSQPTQTMHATKETSSAPWMRQARLQATVNIP